MIFTYHIYTNGNVTYNEGFIHIMYKFYKIEICMKYGFSIWITISSHTPLFTIFKILYINPSEYVDKVRSNICGIRIEIKPKI